MRSYAAAFLGSLALGLLLTGCSAPTASRPPLGGSGGFRQASTMPALTVSGAHTAHQIILGYANRAALEAAVSKVGGRLVSTIPALKSALVSLPGLTSGQALFALQGFQGLAFAQANWTTTPPALRLSPASAQARPLGLAPQVGNPTAAPYYPLEWGLMAPPGGLGVGPKAWQELQKAGVGAGSYTITGGRSRPIILGYFAGPLPPLPDFAGQVIPGFDYRAWEKCTYPGSTRINPEAQNLVNGVCSPPLSLGPVTTAANVLPGVSYYASSGASIEASLDVSNMAANGSGVVGIAYDAKVMPLVSNSLSSYAYANEVIWAVGHGIKILNNSWGMPEASPVITLAVNYALQNGLTMVAASGDSGSAQIFFPAAIPGVIAVTASSENGNLAFFSQIAPYVHLAAPGNNILMASADTFVPCPSNVPARDCPLGTYPLPGYAYVAGTSSSSPYVAGIAALLDAAYARKFDILMTPGEINYVLVKTGNSMPAGTQNYTQLTIPGAAGAVAYVEALAASMSDPSGSAVISVTGSQGQPLNLADVTLTGAGHTYYSQTIYGLADFYDITPGTYRVQVAAPGILINFSDPWDRLSSPAASITVAPGSTPANPDLLLVSMPPTTLTVTLKSADPNLHLAVAEPGNASQGSISGWITRLNGTSLDGSFSSSGETYTLNQGYTVGTYYLGVYTKDLASVASDSATLNLTLNGTPLQASLQGLYKGKTTSGDPPGIVAIVPGIQSLSKAP